MYIPIILGTAREGRQSEKAARFLLGEFEKTGTETELLDVRDYRLPATDNTGKSETAQRWIERITKADGYLIVSPEYNHGYPGELKMALDMAYPEYSRKPTGVCGVSSGMTGGGRAVEQIRLLAVAFGMVPLQQALYFSNIQDAFDGSGAIIDKEGYSKRAAKLFEELLWYAEALKKARTK